MLMAKLPLKAASLVISAGACLNSLDGHPLSGVEFPREYDNVILCLSETGPFDHLARSNVNSCWGALTDGSACTFGIQTVITSPGSRSTPLTLAAARNPRMEALPILDERSAAFYALGLAKSTNRPVALVCTSGSAAANYWPAVVEALMSGTPLLLLTADRPPELRNCGTSGQTIDQCKLYGDYVRHFAELALPEASSDNLASSTDASFMRCTFRSMPTRPVHLNSSFSRSIGTR